MSIIYDQNQDRYIDTDYEDYDFGKIKNKPRWQKTTLGEVENGDIVKKENGEWFKLVNRSNS